jgi:hypothetical protein
MPTNRDSIRTARSAIIARARELGIDVSSERQLTTSTRKLLIALQNLINSGVPSYSSELLVEDAPPEGVFDSANTTFTLSQAPAGLNIRVTFGDVSAGTTLPLRRSTTNPPPADGFFFDVNDPTHIVVGTPPAPADMLVATFRTR